MQNNCCRWNPGLIVAALMVATACGSSPTAPERDPAQPPSGRVASLMVSAVTPPNGTANGATSVTIAGDGFQAGARVTFGDSTTPNITVIDGTRLTVVTPAHTPGPVDVIVTNLDGKSVRVAEAFTYLAPLGPPPVVTSISESVGSTGGGATIVLSGTGFMTGANVTFNGVIGHAGMLPTAFLYEGSLYVESPPHVPGLVDLVVTNPDGQSTRVANGYTYVLPETLDYNGEWEGGTGYDWLAPVRFTIRNNALVNLTCGSASVTFSAPLPVVSGGQFSIKTDNVVMSGRIITATSATGTINAAACPSDMWIAGQATGTYYVRKTQ